MNDENSVCSLRVIVTGNDLEPESVTRILGLTPFKVWRCGEPVLPNSGRKHSTSGWNFSRNLSEDEIPTTLIWIADIIHNSNICRTDNDFNVEVMIVFFGLPQRNIMIPIEAIGVLSKSFITLTITAFE